MGQSDSIKGKREAFLDALEEHRSVLHACRDSQVARSTAYRWRDEEPLFAASWAKIVEKNGEELHQSAFNRALFGWEEPVFWQGQQTATKRVFSDTLTIFMLKLAGYIPRDEAPKAEDVAEQIARLFAKPRRGAAKGA